MLVTARCAVLVRTGEGGNREAGKALCAKPGQGAALTLRG